jgi:hypothetical protein
MFLRSRLGQPFALLPMNHNFFCPMSAFRICRSRLRHDREMTASLRLSSRLLFALFLVGASAPSADADDPTLSSGRTEFEKALQGTRPRPTLDPTVVTFSIGGIQYRIPRHYLTTMDNWSGGPQSLVTVRVNLPDMNPLTEETRACFSAAPSSRPPGCEPLSFTINEPGGPSADEAFANLRRLFQSQVPAEGPAGF